MASSNVKGTAHIEVNHKCAFTGDLQQSNFAGVKLQCGKVVSASRKSERGVLVYAVRDGATLDRPLRVAVVGGGPSGACTAETLAKGGCETYLIERKLDNAKVCVALSLFQAQLSCIFCQKPLDEVPVIYQCSIVLYDVRLCHFRNDLF